MPDQLAGEPTDPVHPHIQVPRSNLGVEGSGRANTNPRIWAVDSNKKGVTDGRKKKDAAAAPNRTVPSNIKGVDSKLAQTILDQIVEL